VRGLTHVEEDRPIGSAISSTAFFTQKEYKSQSRPEYSSHIVFPSGLIHFGGNL
jgi:hypothetical protein